MSKHAHGRAGRRGYMGRARTRNRQDRQARADVRLTLQASRTSEQQLALLEERGHGRCVEARLLRQRITKEAA